MAKRHVVVGGGPAGIFAIETIRDLAPKDDITLISDEPAYSRMVLPYYIAKQIPEKHVYTADDAYYDALKVERHIGARVTALARPNEVLVSSTVKDLVAGSGLRFQDRGVHSLRGVPGEWRLFVAAEG